MGAPVITKAGSSYVSRMSTAVLEGCNLQDWIAVDDSSYVQLAIQHATNLQQLRDKREHWRHQIQSSQLGNAKDLMHHLEQAFSAMVQSKISRS